MPLTSSTRKGREETKDLSFELTTLFFSLEPRYLTFFPSYWRREKIFVFLSFFLVAWRLFTSLQNLVELLDRERERKEERKTARGESFLRFLSVNNFSHEWMWLLHLSDAAWKKIADDQLLPHDRRIIYRISVNGMRFINRRYPGSGDWLLDYGETVGFQLLDSFLFFFFFF